MKKDDLLQLRVSKADMILYRQAAEADGDSLSNWVRRMLRQAVIASLPRDRLTAKAPRRARLTQPEAKLVNGKADL